jgi:hypothetical protein
MIRDRGKEVKSREMDRISTPSARRKPQGVKVARATRKERYLRYPPDPRMFLPS